MSDYKNKQKSLKRPDAFQAKLYYYLDWGRKHSDVVAKAAVPIVVLLIAGIAWLFWQDRSHENRREELSAIDHLYQNEETRVNDQRRQISEELREIVAASSDEKKKDDAELGGKKKQLEDRLKELSPDHSESLAKYVEFFRAHPSRSEGWKAAMHGAQIYLKDKKYAEASSLLEELLKHTKSEFYLLQGRGLFISILEELGEFDKALVQADLLIKDADDDATAKALFVKGRVLLLSGKQSEAMEVLDQVINDHNSSSEAQKAKALKALL